MNSGISINSKLYSLLTTKGISGVSSSQIQPIVAENNVKFPFIIFTRNAVNPYYSKTCLVGDTVNFTIAIIAKTYSESIRICERVREILEFYHDEYFQRIELQNITESFDSDAYVQTMQYKTMVMYSNE